MQEQMGGWQRKTEGRCRKCGITTSLNGQDYCKRCWGKIVLEKAQAEETKKTEEWFRHKKEEAMKKAEEPPPTIDDIVADHERRLTKIERLISQRWGMG